MSRVSLTYPPKQKQPKGWRIITSDRSLKESGNIN